MSDEQKHTPIPLPLSVGEACNWRGENMGRGEEILDATGMTVGNALAHARPYIVEAVNYYDRLRKVNADLLAALERIAREGAYEPTDAELSDREDAGHWLQILGRWDAGEVALAAIARARGEAEVEP